MNAFARVPYRASRRGASMAAVFSAVLLLVGGVAHAAVNSGSTGADGALNPTVNTEIVLPPSGILNYTTVNIPAGVTVTFRKNVTNTPVHLLASGNVTIAGVIDVRGQDGRPTSTYGDGAVGDDGVPGVGGPGGYDGGRGGREDAAQVAATIRGGTGLGPGGGPGGVEQLSGCTGPGHPNYHAIGIGGAYASNAYLYRTFADCGSSFVPTAFGKAYGSELLQPLLGGSGGGGGRGGVTYPGSGGGGGGGAILLAVSGSLQLTGQILATGGDGGGLSGSNLGGQGAGGSGGAIRIVATTMSGNGTVDAQGGCVNSGGNRRQVCGWNGNNGGYGGSPGRIRIEAENNTFSGPSNPAFVYSQPTAIFLTDAPSLRIASVAGQAAPAAPTGNADITLPGSTTGPVEVAFQTTNVPVGNTVRLRMVPAYGQPVEVISPAIAGTDAAGTASASVTLPQGPSTLQATTTYTVVVAGVLDLSRFARNEQVDKVEVTVSLDKETTAKLITASGKTYDVPYQALRAAGFRG